MLVVLPTSATKPVRGKDGNLTRKVSFQILQALVGEESDTEVEAFEFQRWHHEFMALREEQLVITESCLTKGGQVRRHVWESLYPTPRELRRLKELAKERSSKRFAVKPIVCPEPKR
jgi:hypothetical protein